MIVKQHLTPLNSFFSCATCPGWLNLNMLALPSKITAPAVDSKTMLWRNVANSIKHLLRSTVNQMAVIWQPAVSNITRPYNQDRETNNNTKTAITGMVKLMQH